MTKNLFIVHENWRGILQIFGVFSSEDKAEEEINKADNYEDFYITEAQIDVPLFEV